MVADGEYGPSPWQWVRDQVEVYEGSGGADGTTLRDTGLPVVLMTMQGVRSGKVRKVPVMRVEHDGVYAAVASVGGAPENPRWYRNLLAHPQVVLRDRDVVKQVTAREIFGAEKELWWDRAVAAFPPYAEYQTRNSRQIPVFVLE
jgi:deazaflavin-dependent oxidoreductase (nitroreductase family)